MAPFSPASGISDLEISSLELDARSTTLHEFISKALPAHVFKREESSLLPSPAEVFHTLSARDDTTTKTPDHTGAIDPTDINMKGIQALFALIGASFVVAIVWFFFWAKNGGFKWRKGDWDDYKSTVLRRKGPNGTTLSNATKSTILGGGSVVGDGYSDEGGSTVGGAMTETMTDLSSDAPIMKGKRTKKETAKERKIREIKEADWEGGNDNDVRAYMKEKPARVGGINKDSDAFHLGTDYTDTEGSAIHTQRPSRSYGPRGASSSRQGSPEKRQSRRDFSFQNEDNFSTVSSSQPEMSQADYQPPAGYPEIPPPAPPHRPGRYHSPSKQFNQPEPRHSGQHPRANFQESSVVSEVQNQNTKTYHHPLPSLSNQSPARGYRRDRRDSFDD